MINRLIALFVILGISSITCAQTTQNMNKHDSQILVAYFSATGNTKQVAENIAASINGILYEITPAQPYTNADLNWNNQKSRSSVEMDNPESRPAINGKIDTDKYDVIFIGYPIWWNLAPRIINTFIESNNLKGKIIIPFATSGGSSISNSVSILKKTYPDLNWKNGRLINHANGNDISVWLNELGY